MVKGAGMRTIRLFLLIEGVAFITAALIHFGVLAAGFQHFKAGVAESVIGAVLTLGLLLTVIRPFWTRPAGLAAQGFALLGTAVGIFTIAIGIGPRTVPDIVYHIVIVAVLVSGLIAAARTPRIAG
jgi:hypothetical protein